MRVIVDTDAVQVHLLEATRGSYAYLIDGGGRTVLCDTGFPGRAQALLSELEDAVRRLSDIVITHYDVDHVGSLKALEERIPARIWLPADDAPYILRERPRPGLKRLIAAVTKAPPPAHWAPLRDGDHIGLLTAVRSPGHTPGHLAYRGPGFLLVGDALVTHHGRAGPSPAVLAWNPELMRETATRLLSGYSGWILPAHGEPVQVGGTAEAAAKP